MPEQQIHRRKSSKGEDENVVIMAPPPDPVALNEQRTIGMPPAGRTRVQSTPQHSHNRNGSFSGGPPSAGPFRTSFPVPRQPNGANGLPTSPFRASFANQPLSAHSHSRTRSVSTPFSPALPSPLSTNFPSSPPANQSVHAAAAARSPTMYTFPASQSSNPEIPLDQAALAPKHTRRHSRMHSRNLSVFFPRPGSLPSTSIAEDGSQELEVLVDEEAPAMTIPSAGSSISLPGKRNHNPPTPLGQGFTFGGRPPSTASSLQEDEEFLTGPRSATVRRGHHHKHSLSHNFFSFLEPGRSTEEDLHTQPTPVPVSPWAPISAFPQSAAPNKTSFEHAQNGIVDLSHSHGHEHDHSHSHSPHLQSQFQHQHHHDAPGIDTSAAAAGLAQFILGAWLWVRGQQVGSLSVTGLGYWIVFDAFGVGLSKVVPGWLASAGTLGEKEKEKMRRPYGNGRVETVFMFAQTVYLMFSSVYVCKETVEHLLLSAGGGEGHHHHHGDEEGGLPIEYPIIMAFITFLSLLGTALFYDNHLKLVNVTGNRIPSFGSMIRSLSSSSRQIHHDPPPTSPIALALTNPFVSSPLLFCLIILFVALGLPAAQHRAADLILAGLITVLTFNVAYRGSVVLGTVLLQTSPPRGLASGKMEAFLRAMREVERHPQVLHLPAPHIWQLTPSPASTVSAKSKGQAESLVVTMQLHVREDLGDDDVLQLTRWAWEKCVGALGEGLKDSRQPEVTVGVVRG
ncbi:hypothetical protein BDQ12DRAFT_739896 [Crucibulum laeve]|uniref:Cation efflux protein transmembrane domain-containing protein n=1 Tax=Crucibulum laeve TaxID=68775 RepID=A0A5C3LET5_9AGAR|nr:hypothetical protein BDQ12DRAFT_739896 [Crucibulum laeve]